MGPITVFTDCDGMKLHELVNIPKQTIRYVHYGFDVTFPWEVLYKFVIIS